MSAVGGPRTRKRTEFLSTATWKRREHLQPGRGAPGDLAALVYLGHQVAAMELSMENADTGEVVQWEREQFSTHSPGPGDAMGLHLEDLVAERPESLEAGHWTLTVRVLKALGDEAEPGPLGAVDLAHLHPD